MPVLTESSSLGPARRIYPIERDAITIGRSFDNAIVVKDCTASKRHARIALDDGRYTLRDLGSRNGTYVNGDRVSEQVLREGDEIRVGASRFRLLPQAPEGLAGPMTPGPTPSGESSRRFSESDHGGGAPTAEAAIDRMWALARTMHLARDPIDFITILVNGFVDILGADRGTLVVLEEGGGHPTMRIDGERDVDAALEAPDPRVGAFRRAIETRATVVVEAGQPGGAVADGPSPRHVLAIPLLPHMQLVAVAYLERFAHRQPFSRRELKIGELEASLAGHGFLAALR